jgi:hypothetical protein
MRLWQKGTMFLIFDFHAQQLSCSRDGVKTAIRPRAFDNLNVLVVFFQPFIQCVKERYSLGQFRLATLTIVGPLDILR